MHAAPARFVMMLVMLWWYIKIYSAHISAQDARNACVPSVHTTCTCCFLAVAGQRRLAASANRQHRRRRRRHFAYNRNIYHIKYRGKSITFAASREFVCAYVCMFGLPLLKMCITLLHNTRAHSYIVVRAVPRVLMPPAYISTYKRERIAHAIVGSFKCVCL